MPEIIYYDGHCGLCHGFVKFVLAHDPQARFSFTPLDQMPAAERQGLPDSVVVRTTGGMLTKSDAVLYVLRNLGGIWAAMAGLAQVFPRLVRDFMYDAVAKLRYRIFGRRQDVCPLVPPELRKRFQP